MTRRCSGMASARTPIIAAATDTRLAARNLRVCCQLGESGKGKAGSTACRTITPMPPTPFHDTGARHPTLLFVFTPSGNAVRSAGYVKPGNLLESRYESLREEGV